MALRVREERCAIIDRVSNFFWRGTIPNLDSFANVIARGSFLNAKHNFGTGPD
jgi:hypothetical protein